MTIYDRSGIHHRRGTLGLQDFYIVALAGSLACYATFGKGFAYLGMPPVFVSEMLLSFGLVILLRSGCWIAVLTTIPSLVLTALMAWVVVRTSSYVGVYGADALRDSVTVMYGLFAFIMIALLIDSPARISVIMGYLYRFSYLYGGAGVALFLGSALFDRMGLMPKWAHSGIPIALLKPGEVAVHLAASGVAALLGVIPRGPLWTAALFSGMLVVSTQNRGSILAIVVPTLFAALATGRLKQLIKVVAAVLVLIGVISVFNVNVRLGSGSRTIGAEQITRNLGSILSSEEAPNSALEGTKRWRLLWWKKIQDYTLHGPYFWTGKGFGVNLARSDGFVVGEKNEAPLRSPHNVHMTVLARAGIPGLFLWLLFGGVWFATLAYNMMVARSRGDGNWANCFVFIICYVTAIAVNASFDVALEGPMLGIWFWNLVGLGIGASIVYKASASAALTKIRSRNGIAATAQSQSHAVL
jgi:hypothetical protein